MIDLLDGFDPGKKSLLEPEMVVRPKNDFPLRGVSCFSKKLHDAMLKKFGGEEIGSFFTEEGGIPIYSVNYRGEKVALYMSRVGAPASVIQMEEMIVMGVKKLMVIGSCGTLDAKIKYGDLVIPTSGIRDEGTSYHYLSPEEEVATSRNVLTIILEETKKTELSCWMGKTWTTDGLYRETPSKYDLRKKQGCLAVEMEYTALQAVAIFRGIEFGQILYCEDNLDCQEWEPRGYLPNSEDRLKKILCLPFDCVLRI